MNEFDIIEDIHAIRTEEKIQLRGLHVKSHQTSNGPIPLEVQLNEECDRLAKERVFDNDMKMRSKSLTRSSPSAKAAFYIQGNLITNNIKQRMMVAGQREKITGYLRDRNQWTQETVEAIDWEMYSVALDRVFKASKSRFARIIKFNHNLQNTGRQKKLFTARSVTEPAASDRCPLCGRQEETTMHLYWCSDESLKDIREEGIHELEEELRDRHIPGNMWKAIARGIWAVQSENDPTDWEPPNTAIAEAYKEQTVIGWQHFLKGRLSKKWGTLLQQWYSANPAWRRLETKRRTLLILIGRLWTIYDQLWCHRCDVVHDLSDVEALSVTAMDARIRFLYANKLRLFDSGDYDCFHLGVNHTLALPTSQKKAWIANMSIRAQATERNRVKITKQMKPITEYFPPIQSLNDQQES